jgi:hypothetical protein
VIHGLKTEEAAKGIVSILRDYKDYKLPNTAYIISNDNYKIVQIKKNFEAYLKTPASDPLPPAPEAPMPSTSGNNPIKSQPQTVPSNDVLGGDDTENNMAPPDPNEMSTNPGDPSAMKKEKK